MTDGVDDIVKDIKHSIVHILARTTARVRRCMAECEQDMQKIELLEDELKAIEGGGDAGLK